ncbi:hypothetical protein GCM10023090_01960 [Acidovorax lacteus]|uniref:Uncharacterized protein n=1 Tax=Acidovorax lacteus TaxID=1924988 RepID=A0ABP8KWL4_9BURK
MTSSKGWTPERRAQQAARIREQQPWLKSTGPKSAAGKATVSRNAFKGGYWRELRDMARDLDQCLLELRRGLDKF